MRKPSLTSAAVCRGKDRGLAADSSGRVQSYRATRTLVLDALAGRADRAVAAERALAHLEASPAEPFLLNATGVLLHGLGRGGRPLVEAALRLDPGLPGAAANLAEMPALAEQRQHAIAVAAAPAERPTLTLCLIVRDEAELLPACLDAAVPQADELIVVDTGSSDDTVAIARSYGARVLEVPWEGSFSPPKNVALAAAHGDWILFLDADEQLQGEVRPLLRRSWREAFLLPMTSLAGDGSDVSVHPALRLWRSRRDRRFSGRVHERIEGLPFELPERFELAETGILHLGYLDRYVRRRGKTERNLTLLAQEEPGPYTAFNRGSEHARAGDWARAAACFDDALAQLGPARRDVGYGPLLAARAARARRETGRVDEARALLEEALRDAPEYTDLAYELACCAVEAGDRAEAAALLRRCLAQGDAPATYLGRAGTGSFLARRLLHLLGDVSHKDGAAFADIPDMIDRLRPVSTGDISVSAPRAASTAAKTSFKLATPSGVPATPPAEVLKALDTCQGVDEDLRSRGFRVSFSQGGNPLGMSIVDTNGTVVKELSPTQALDVFSGVGSLDDLLS